MNDLLQNISPFYLWVLAGIVLAIAELLTAGFLLLAFSIGCFLAAIVGIFAGLNAQLITFCIGSLISFFTFRRVFNHDKDEKDPEERQFGVDGFKGKIAKVLEKVTGDEGYVQVGGERWPARVQDRQHTIEPGVDVRIVDIEGNKLMVEHIQ